MRDLFIFQFSKLLFILKKNLVRILLVVFLIGLSLWFGMTALKKNLEDFFFWQEISKDPEIFARLFIQPEMERRLEKLKPLRNWQIEDLKIEAKSAISVEIDKMGFKKILFQQNSERKLPIASLSKLMTALIVLENYDLSQKIKINKDAVEEEGDFGNLKVGEIFSVEDLLYSLLIESSNDAAMALVEMVGQEKFVDLMNAKAKNLGLENTFFANATGLDPDNDNDPINYSTAQDLIRLTDYLLNNQPKIWQILSRAEFIIESPKGVYHHTLKNTNKLLAEIPHLIGGKTGWTPRAGGCLLLVMRSPSSGNYLVNIILGTKGREERFAQMKKLINWINLAYQW